MTGERYGMDDGNPPRERSRVKVASRQYVSEEGEFSAPLLFSTTPSKGLMHGDTNYEMSEEFIPELTLEFSSEIDEGFVFDEDPLWEQPIESVPMGTCRQVAYEHLQLQKNRKAQENDQHRSKQSNAMGPPKKNDQRANGRNWVSYLYIGIITVSVLGMFVLGVMMMPQMAGYFWKDLGNYAFINGELLRYDQGAVNSYKQYRSYMTSNVIYPGIFVDGVHVGGMTIDEARTALTAVGSDAPNTFSVTVAIGDKQWIVDSSNVPATRDLGNVLERAYAVGRTNTTAIHTTIQTPFRERLDKALALRDNTVNLTTTATYDHNAVKNIVEEIASFVTREPVDAQIASFDFNQRIFTFSKEQLGVTFDKDLLYQKIIGELDNWKSNTTVTVDPVVTPPTVTQAELAKRCKLVAAYTTDTTKDSNRNTNIGLACQAINGTTLLPGQTFSFNETTGQRTTSKGYKSAGAIAAGQSIEEVGGGICQVSSTIFNAVARANLEIVYRSPHAWPSTYVNRGEDATVNWPNLDFKFKNNTNSPIFLITYYKDRKMSTEIWGVSLGDGVSIELESQVIKTMEPSGEIKYVANPALAFGESKPTVKARTGYVVETYKIWYTNGKEQKRELMHTSTYKAYQQVIEYN